MNREFLESLKINEEPLPKSVVDSIMSEYETAASALNSQINTLQGELSSARVESKNAAANTENTLKAKYGEDLKNAKAAFSQKIKDFAVDCRVKLSGARDAKDIISLLDMSKIKMDDESGEISGIEEQINALKENKAYLFHSESEKGASGLEHGSEKTEELTADNKMREIMGLPPKKG